ncbi:MAG: POTRA domain-containing protein [Flavobacteriaceae bacterium]|nr:POTRA domain-containing protein [Flavobacteriaceae bacterium]
MKKLFVLTLSLVLFNLHAQQDSTALHQRNIVNFEMDSTRIETNFLNLPQDTIVIEQPGTAVQLMSTYVLKGLEVSGGTPYSTNQILRFTGLELNEEIEVPGSKINNAIKKLWRTNLFSDVEFFASKVVGRDIFLRVNLIALPRINEIEIEGVKKGKKDEILKANNLKENEKITLNLINQTKINIKKYFVDKGYPDAQVDFITTPVEGKNLTEDVKIVVNQGPRVKVKDIIIEGNKEVRASKLRNKGFKNTTRTDLKNILKASKLIPEKYEEDKEKLIDVYKGYGFRDAKIVSDTVTRVSNDRYVVKLTVDEGKRYYVGDISFVGNSVYNTETLSRILSYKKGDPYDAVGINQKVSGSTKDDDIHTLYLNSGYLFSEATPIEKSVKNDTIDLEIRIREGEQARWNRVTFNGNTQTHDHVIARELYTRPGDLFSKSDIQRTYFKLGSLGYFDPQQITQDIQPNMEDNTVDIDWKLAPKSSSQIELQGGYGGGRFIGTLGLTFQNFSIGNLFKGEAWKPVPLGDGQALSIRAQAGSYFSNYSISFTEPWIGGSRPTALSMSIYNSNFRNLYSSDDSSLRILGASVGLNKLLTWPDDYFRLSQAVSYQNYDFQNYRYNIGTIQYENGTSHNLAYQIGLSRLSAGNDPVFPTYGSDFNVSLKLTPPYSLLSKNKDYAAMQRAGDFEGLYKWLEYYKIQFSGNWYTELIGKLVLRTGAEFGFLGSYNKEIGVSPFERFFMGGTGLQANRFDGREIVPLRGYDDFTDGGGQAGRDITPLGGGTIYDKFLLELRYPITMGQQAKIFGLTFFEAGNTWSDKKEFKPFELKRSAGVGVRVFMSAFGMLGFDFGYGFDPYLNSGTQASGWQTHFIFGQSF